MIASQAKQDYYFYFMNPLLYNHAHVMRDDRGSAQMGSNIQFQLAQLQLALPLFDIKTSVGFSVTIQQQDYKS